MKGQHNLTNKFFYKYYNDTIEDIEIFEHITDEMYMFVMQKINKYNASKQNKLNYDQYTYWLFNTINKDYPNEVTNLKNNI